MLGRVASGDTAHDVTVPRSDSPKAVRLMRERFPQFAGASVDVVYTAGSESVRLVAALVILLVPFGSVLAAGLPLVIAGFGLGVGWVARGCSPTSSTPPTSG